MKKYHLSVIVTLMVLSIAGCAVQEKDIEAWKHTVKGPTKLVAVTLADKYALPLRAKAATALVEMERQDVDGVVELQKAVQKLKDSEKGPLAAEVAKNLANILSASQVSGTEGPKPAEVRAKDAAFLLVPFAKGPEREKLIGAVVNWFTLDFSGRNLAGNFSAEQVIKELGPSAAPLLTDALSYKLPAQALVKLTELIGQLGNTEAKAKAAEKIVKIESEMNGPEYLNWLKGEITKQLQEKDPSKPADKKKVDTIATMNRNNFISDGPIAAMKYLADQDVVANRLLSLAASNADVPLRTRALQALEGKARKEHLQKLLELALNNNNPPPVRDYAFDRVGDIRSMEALPRMWPLLQGDDARLRWRAGEMILAIGGNAVMNDFYAKLPGDADYPPEELEGYATRIGQINPLPNDAMKAQLNSSKWWARVIALRYFARKGSKGDAAEVGKLVNDSAKPKGKGWGSQETVGTIAKETLQVLEQKT